MAKAFISIEKIQALHNSLDWLHRYEPQKDTYEFVGLNINTEQAIPTEWLQELGRINKRRFELINLLMSYKTTQ